MKEKTKKFWSRTAKVAVTSVTFLGTLVGAYFLVPNRTRTVKIEVKEQEQTAFEKFVAQLTRDVGLEDNGAQNDANYLHATFDNFQVAYKVSDESSENYLGVEGCLDFRMHDLSLSGVEFNLDANINYNNRELPLTLGHFQDTVYFRIKDLKLKYSHNEEFALTDEELINLVISDPDFDLGGVSASDLYGQPISMYTQYFLYFKEYAGIDFDNMFEGLGSAVTTKIEALAATLMDGLSLDGMSNLQTSEVQSKATNDWIFTISISEDINIVITSDENFKLKRVDLGTIKAGAATISGAINFDFKPYNEFVSPASDDNYVEIFNYSGMLKRFASLLNEDNQKIALAFSADLDEVRNNSATDIAKVNGSINVDIDQLLDLDQYRYGAEPQEPAQNSNENESEEESNVILDTLEKVGFNFQLDLIGQNDIEYANLDIAFIDGEGYVRFNEQEDGLGNKSSVMKLKIDTETMNWLVTKLPEVLANLSGDESTDTLETLSSFLNDDVANAIKNYDFSFILDMITTLSNTVDGIELGIDLSSLGIGDDAYVDLKINNNASNMLDLDVRNLAFGDFQLDLDLNSADFSAPELGQLDAYESVKFLPDVIEQVATLVDEQKTGFTISGSVLDEEGLGITIEDGLGQFDNGENVKAGYGSLVIKEYKYYANQVWAKHQLAVSVSNLKENISEDANGKKNNQNEALFVYGVPGNDDKNIKGKMHLQSFVDIIDIVKTFINGSEENNFEDAAKDDPKFTKFLAPITKLLGMAEIGNIISSKDYMKLASNELLKSVHQFNNGHGIEVVIGGGMIGLASDLTLRINFKGDNTSEDQSIESIEVVDLRIGEDNVKHVNFKLGLVDYDNNLVNHVNPNATYMNLDGITTLLQLGINTTKANFYHLSAEALIKSGWNAINIPLKDINFYIYVDGTHVKVYGKIGSVPLINLVVYGLSSDFKVTTHDISMFSELTFETYDDNDPNRPEGDDVGGYFNIRRTFVEYDKGISIGSLVIKKPSWEYTEHNFRCTSKNFMDNILEYLICDLIGLKKSIVFSDIIDLDSLGGSDTTPKADGYFANAFTSKTEGFKHTVTGSGMSTVNTFNLGLNLDVLTGISALKEANITIKSMRAPYGATANGIDVLSSLDAALKVQFLIELNVTFNASVKEVQFGQSEALSSWNTKCNSKFVEITTANIHGQFNDPSNPYDHTWTVK